MEDANSLIDGMEKQLIEVKYYLNRGLVESAAIKSEYVQRYAVQLHELLNRKVSTNEKI